MFGRAKQSHSTPVSAPSIASFDLSSSLGRGSTISKSGFSSEAVGFGFRPKAIRSFLLGDIFLESTFSPEGCASVQWVVLTLGHARSNCGLWVAEASAGVNLHTVLDKLEVLLSMCGQAVLLHWLGFLDIGDDIRRVSCAGCRAAWATPEQWGQISDSRGCPLF